MKEKSLIRKIAHHFQLTTTGLLVILVLVACNSEEFVQDANQLINPMPSIPASNVSQQDQDAQRRPFPTPFPTLEVPPTPTPTPEPGEGLEEELEFRIEDLEYAFGAMLYADALRASIANENLTNGEQASFILEFIRPDSLHLLSQSSEIVILDGLTYRRESGTNWLISPGQSMESFEGVFDPYFDEAVAETQINGLLSNAKDVRFVGQRMINDTTYNVVTFTMMQSANLPPQEKTFWLGVEDGLLYRQITDFMENEQNIRTTIAYVYGEDVEIARPYP